MRFSERYGYKPVREVIQKESIDDELKVALWNAYLDSIDQSGDFDSDFYVHIQNYNLYPLYKVYWKYLFKMPYDEMPETLLETNSAIRSYFFHSLEWFELYDFIEITLENIPSNLHIKYKTAFIVLVNKAL